MFKTTLIAAALSTAALSAQADTLALWNFNDLDATVDQGAGTALVIGGSTTSSFVSDNGSTDPAATGSSWSITSFPAAGSGDKTRGFQFNISSAGFEDLVFSFDNRNSNTAARHAVVQYALDGSSFVDAALVTTDLGGVFFNGRMIDLSMVPGTSNNANLAIRIVSTFAPGTGDYTAANSNNSYGTTGTMRLDMVSLSGSAIAAVPEPGTYALLLAGLGLVGAAARRRRA